MGEFHKVCYEAWFVLLHSDDDGGGEKLKLNLNVLPAMVDLNSQIVYDAGWNYGLSHFKY